MDEEDAVRGGLSPLSRLICKIVYSVGQGNFTFVLKKSGNFRTSGYNNHVKTRESPLCFLKKVMNVSHFSQ